MFIPDPGVISDPQHCTKLQVRNRGGTYHNTATLVGDVPDLQSQLRVLGRRHQLRLDILHLVLVQLALRLPLRTSAIIE
jgi:hypothetical protein